MFFVASARKQNYEIKTGNTKDKLKNPTQLRIGTTSTGKTAKLILGINLKFLVN